MENGNRFGEPPCSLMEQRNLALQDIYNRIRKMQVNQQLVINDIIVSIVIEQPAPRFYITPIAAKKMILAYYKQGGRIPQNMRKHKQELMKDLIQNYEELQRKFPHTPKEKLYEYVVKQPAKSFYMTHDRVRDVILNYRRKWRMRHSKYDL